MAQAEKNNPETTEAQTDAQDAAKNGGAPNKTTKVGLVVSDKMDKTVVVAVKGTYVHPLYHRYVSKTKRFAAHDEANECRVGDKVEIVSSRPLSRTKRWRVREILERGQ